MAELSAAGLSAEAIAGGKGQYDVVADGNVVFSKILGLLS